MLLQRAVSFDASSLLACRLALRCARAAIASTAFMLVASCVSIRHDRLGRRHGWVEQTNERNEDSRESTVERRTGERVRLVASTKR